MISSIHYRGRVAAVSIELYQLDAEAVEEASE
jgi:hypothetical protein